MKSLALMILTVYSLSACTTLETVHVPVGCLGQPSASLGMTQSEYDAMAPETLKKLVVFAKTLRKRIDTQCEINHAHDLIHEGKK